MVSTATPRFYVILTVVDPKFYEVQAVILSNMGKDKEALEIYVFKLKTFEKAEE